MAAGLNLRNFPESLRQTLKVKAIQAGKSLEEYATSILRAAK